MRVLHIQLDSNFGGIESFCLNVLKNIDRDYIQFDFVEYGSERRNYNERFIELGAKIYSLPSRIQHPIKSARKLEKIIQDNEYSIVHIHKNSLADTTAINVCLRNGVHKIIIHSHNSDSDRWGLRILHKFNQRNIRLDRCIRLACSYEAGRWLYGNRFDFEVVKNGVDINRFRFCIETRKKARNELGIDGYFVVGIVGKMEIQKNYDLAIDILHECRLIDKNIKLLCIGSGELQSDIRKRVSLYGDSENVLFVGNVENVEYYYNAMDMFIMPSLYEGFPIAAVEAQVNGLKCALSANITRDICISNRVCFYSIEEKNDWVGEVCNSKYLLDERNNGMVIECGEEYNIMSTVKTLEKLYTIP